MEIKILFVGVTELKEKSVLEAMVDEKKAGLAIQEFQKFECYRLLGKVEYLRLENVLLESIKSVDPVPLSPADKELMTYIKDYMIYGALMYSVPKISTKWSNKGLMSDNDLNADKVDPQTARSDYAFKLDAAKSALIDYMNEVSEVSKCCKSANDTSFNFTGVHVPDNYRDVNKAYKDNNYKTNGGGRVIL